MCRLDGNKIIRYLVRQRPITTKVSKNPSPSPIPILFEDNHLLVAEKPSGMLSQPGSASPFDALTLLKEYLCRKRNRDTAFLGLVMRLDRNVSGVIAFAKTSKAASRVSELLRKRDDRIEKTYAAVVSGLINIPKDQTPITLHHRLIPSTAPGQRTVCFDYPKDTNTPLQDPKKFQTAQLLLTPLAHFNSNTFVKIRLLTGRKHQIRAQMAHIGHPIIGDTLYGSKYSNVVHNVDRSDKRLLLHAFSLKLQHPTTQEMMTFSSPLPLSFLPSNLSKSSIMPASTFSTSATATTTTSTSTNSISHIETIDDMEKLLRDTNH